MHSYGHRLRERYALQVGRTPNRPVVGNAGHFTLLQDRTVKEG